MKCAPEARAADHHVPVAASTARDPERVRSPAGIGQVEVREKRPVRVRVLDLDTDVDRVELDIRD